MSNHSSLPPACRLLNSTRTRAGAQLLRANLLQPLRDIATITLRYDCVAELIASDKLLTTLTACLSQLPRDLDKCVSLPHAH